MSTKTPKTDLSNNVDLGNIMVHKGEPPKGNPYRGTGRVSDEDVTHVHGNERSEALGKFLRGKGAGVYTFWYAPTYGGSKRYDEPPRVHKTTLDYYWNADGVPWEH